MSTTYTTRSGRTIKKPELYTPQEVPEDDFKPDEYDDDNDDDDVEEDDEDEDEEDEDEDADEKGNLKGFIIEDEESDSECD